jgi:hypothetical protein
MSQESIMHQRTTLSLFAALALTTVSALSAQPGTAFTYQGLLNTGGTPATGLYDLGFALFDAPTGLNQQGSTVFTNGVPITNGLFTVTLDFGSAVFGGAARWLEIGVRTNGGSAYTSLTPRQALTPVPYSLYAPSAGSAANMTGTLPATQLTGTLPDPRLSPNVALLNANQAFTASNTFRRLNVVDGVGTDSGSLHVGGYGLNGDPKVIYFGDGNYVYLGETGTDDRMELRAGEFYFNFGKVGIGGVAQDALLDVQGNIRLNRSDLFLREVNDRNHGLGWYGGGKLFGGVNVDGPVLYGFSGGALGTTVSTNLALRWTSDGKVWLDPHGLNSGNLTPGLAFGVSSGEGISSKRTAGGNQYGLDFYANYQVRMSLANDGELAVNGVVDTLNGVPMELRANGTRALRLESGSLTNGSPSLIGGSPYNVVDAGVLGAFIGGGGATNYYGSIYTNRVSSDFGVVVGGADNAISTNASYGVIGGGRGHRVQSLASYATIGGGDGNDIWRNADSSTIAGGGVNSIQTNAAYGTVSGGLRNAIGTNCAYATLGGGRNNTITNAAHATVPGGYGAVASHYGQLAYASGRLNSYGDAQASQFVLRVSSSGSSAYTLALDGDTGTQFLTIPTGARWTFDILLIGSQLGGPSASFQMRGAIRNDGGNVAFIGSPSVTSLGADAGASAWTASPVANNSSDSLDLVVHGSGAVWTYWVANVRTAEVTPY